MVMLALGACGGGDSDGDAASGSTTSATAAPSTTSSTAQSTSSTAQSGAIGAGLLSERCRSYTGYAAAVGLAMAAAVNPEAAAQIEELKGKADIADAPAEIRDDFAVLIDYARKLGEVFAKYPNQNGGLNPAVFADMAALAQTVDQQRLEEASKNIETWVAANCTGY
jgi:hypothetical protein